MPIPIDQRGKAASVKVHLSSGAGVDIGWADGHASHFDFAYLRDQCPCAMCNDERLKKEDAAKHIGGAGNSAALPMFKPRPTAVAAQAVGNYALQVDFNDGHRTGIFSFHYLRTICPCGQCAQLRSQNPAR